VQDPSVTWKLLREAGHALRLRVPAANEPTGKILHALMIGLLIWVTLEGVISSPFASRRATGVLALLAIQLTIGVTLSLLRLGLLRLASLVYLAATWLLASTVIFLTGGIYSAGLVFHATLPISAAWLLGYDAALWTAGACLVSSLGFVILEMEGIGPWWFTRGGPLGLWFLLVEATVTATVPVAQTLKILRTALAQSKSAEEALRSNEENLEETLRQRTAELVEARDQALAANRSKSVFLANMSHELQTPLNVILGLSALARDDRGLSEQRRKDLEIINRSGEHLLSLIDQVLDAAKIGAGSVNVMNGPVDLGDLLPGITEMMRLRAEEKGLRLILMQSSDCPPFVRTDGAKLRQVLINVIDNAVKYTDHGNVTLRAEAKSLGYSRDLLLVFDVLDTGIGIAREDRARIFDLFTQVGKTTHEGTGLGLTITKYFVELMGGTMGVQSEPGKASLFHVELPVKRVREAEEPVLKSNRKQIARIAPGQPKYRILIVEDRKENWLLLQRLLEEVGFSVRVAENGADGASGLSLSNR
jgi:signal transduction histidine kinase